MKLIKNIPIKIDKDELLKILKIKKESAGKINDNLARLIDEEIARGMKLARPQALYEFRKVINSDGDGVEIEGGIKIGENTFKNYMTSIDRICFALVTIGPALEEEADKLQKDGEYTRAMILDAVGSVAVEDAAGNLNHMICDKLKGKKTGISRRFSPGYGKFKVKEQKKISDIIPFKKIGVALTSSFMMVPQKSISFCLYTGKLKKEIPGTCNICGMKDCPYRSC
ncbi:MAG: hypothetical protein HZA77_10310 [Candidatus Schekmanbacteria bacterium]|nr:hypothetical protein [Candidatus Schekmanbacteria bacterium]